MVDRVLYSFTEISDNLHSGRKQLKLMFMDRDKKQLIQQLKDLEKTITINKEIIHEMCVPETGKHDTKSKRIIEKLNTENAHLTIQVKRLTKQRDEAQSKLLIVEQIIEDYKGKERETNREYMEKINELTDQLNRKEYVLQSFEKKYFQAERILKKYSHYEQEIKIKLKELNVNINEERRITNVVEENDHIKSELKFASSQIKSLHEQIEKYTNICNDQEKQILNMRQNTIHYDDKDDELVVDEHGRCHTTIGISNMSGANKLRIPTLDLGQVKKLNKSDTVHYMHKLEESIKFLNKKITGLKEENLNFLQKNVSLEKTNANLYKLNERLSVVLNEANARLKGMESNTVNSSPNNRDVNRDTPELGEEVKGLGGDVELDVVNANTNANPNPNANANANTKSNSNSNSNKKEVRGHSPSFGLGAGEENILYVKSEPDGEVDQGGPQSGESKHPKYHKDESNHPKQHPNNPTITNPNNQIHIIEGPKQKPLRISFGNSAKDKGKRLEELKEIHKNVKNKNNEENFNNFEKSFGELSSIEGELDLEGEVVGENNGSVVKNYDLSFENDDEGGEVHIDINCQAIR